MSVEEVLKWIETADKDDLLTIADTLIERELVASLDDVSDGSYDFEDRDDDLDPELLAEAAARLRRREYREAMHVLANALGPDFSSLESMLGAA